MKSFILTTGFVLLLATAHAQKKLTAINTSKGIVVEHTATSGESLLFLSAKYGISLSGLAKANGMKTDQGVRIGQVIKVPVTTDNLTTSKKGIPVYYEVGAKDNLTTISRKFNKVDTKTLKTWNKLKKDTAPKGKELLVGYMVDHYAGKKGEQTSDKKEVAKTESKKDQKKSDSKEMTVVGTSLNIRKGPSTDQPIVGAAQQNETVSVLRQVNKEWVSVRTKDGIEGYAASQFLGPEVKNGEVAQAESPKPQKELSKTTTSQKMTVIGTTLNIRKGPGTDQPIVGTALQNETLTLVRQVNDEWASVKTKDGVEGYAASQFLGPEVKNEEVAKAEPQKPEKEPSKTTASQKMTVIGTTLNIRKGPGTDQPIIGTALQNETLTLVREVNNEWASVRTAGGVEGYAASQFMGPEVKNEDIVNAEPAEKAVAKNTKAAKRNDDQPEPMVSSAPVAEMAPAADLDESGFFKKEYEQQTNPALSKDQPVHSGIFKTQKGWSDGKYYVLMDDVASGTIVKLSNPSSSTFVYAKVLGDMKSLKQKSGPTVRISDAAATALRINDNDFDLVVTH